jgi:hypothetical protein
MLVILQNEQLLAVDKICQGCLLATQNGLPRWDHGKLGCGHYLGRMGDHKPIIYECDMGFRLANIE